MRFVILTFMFLSLTGLCRAEDAKLQAASFARFYNSFCIHRMNDLDDLKRELGAVAQLAPAGAELFLNGKPGGAWPLPDLEGLFVLALPDDEPLCTVYARRADAAYTEELFIKLVSAPVAPLLTRKITDGHMQTPKNGTAHVLEYEWYMEDSSRRILFTLSTSELENADLQVTGSVFIVEGDAPATASAEGTVR